MSYIGKEPQYADFLSKFFNGDGTAMTVTLDASPPNEAALLVFIDGVRQDTSAYTVSGYSLTFTGTVPSGTNNVQVVHLGIAQDTQVPVDDSVSTAKIQDDAVTSAKLANSLNITSGNSLTIDSGATITNNGTASGFGKVVQYVQTTSNTSGSTTSVIPDDASIPQNTEGYELFTASITPTSATNKLLITSSVALAGAGVCRLLICLFQDSTADALAVSDVVSSGSNQGGTGALAYWMDAGTTSSTTFKIRIGPTVNTCYFGRKSTVDPYFGGTMQHNLTIIEYAV